VIAWTHYQAVILTNRGTHSLQDRGFLRPSPHIRPKTIGACLQSTAAIP